MQSEIKRMLTINDGILSDNINDIQYDSLLKIAYIATTEGVMELHLNMLKESFSSTFKIDDVLIKQGEMLFRPKQNINFTYKQNSFTIKFHSFNYTNPAKVNYQYSLDN